MCYLGCMVVSVNLGLEMRYLLSFNYALLELLLSALMSSSRKDMVLVLESPFSLLPIFGRLHALFSPPHFQHHFLGLCCDP